MKPHAKRRIALKRVYHDLLNTVCQLECELDFREQELVALRRTKANLVRWAKRYRKKVLAQRAEDNIDLGYNAEEYSRSLRHPW